MSTPATKPGNPARFSIVPTPGRQYVLIDLQTGYRAKHRSFAAAVAESARILATEEADQ